jgi:hypothetical protein
MAALVRCVAAVDLKHDLAWVHLAHLLELVTVVVLVHERTVEVQIHVLHERPVFFAYPWAVQSLAGYGT